MPNRIIKETICTSDSLSQLSDFEENLFYKLLVNCDDYGRFDARPAIVKSRCYPLRERLTLKNIEDALSSLARVGCVKLYQVDGKPYLHLPTWEVHQQIRAKKSKFPEPDNNGYQLIADDIKCPRNPIQSESNPNPIGNSASERFHPPSVEAVREYCTKRGNKVDAERFVDFYTSKGWKVGKNLMVDWESAVRTWEKEDKRGRSVDKNTRLDAAGDTTCSDKWNLDIPRL